MPVPETLDANDTRAEGKHIKAAEFPPNWKANLVISDVNLGKFKREGDVYEKQKFILSFVGKEKTYVCNETNKQFLSAALGSKPARWVGATITMSIGKTKFNGGMVPCFMIVGAVPAPQHQPDRTPGDDESDTPF